ncbi:MAG: T9SS type A sorting domain-containing protein, partial [Bacteroidales bacterium]|nr:T9SS type A sorting domain-containing protein [Bacteroidales bacterium]
WVYEVDATRDFTGDGNPDVLACAGGSTTGQGADRAFCLNGTNGSLEWDYYFGGPGFSVKAINDVNGDGIPEALAGASNDSETQGITACIDGSTGYEIWTELAAGSSVWALLQLDDINSDGVNDVGSGEFGTGDYKIFDAANGDVLFDGSIGGGYVIITDMVRLDDVNDDGFADFTIQSSSSNLVVIDGYSGGSLWLTALDDQAQKVNRIPDISGDGINDVAAGTLYQNNYVYFVDGVNGDIIHSLGYSEPVDALSVIPDINGDLSWEVVAGGRQGKVVCYSGGLDAITSLPSPSKYDGGIHLTANPNPFTDQSLILLSAHENIRGRLTIITAGGRMVRDFGQKTIGTETIEISWNGKSDRGRVMPSGLYFVVLSIDNHSKVLKLIKQ